MNPLPFILLAISLPLLLGGCGEKSVNEEELEEEHAELDIAKSFIKSAPRPPSEAEKIEHEATNHAVYRSLL